MVQLPSDIKKPVARLETSNRHFPKPPDYRAHITKPSLPIPGCPKRLPIGIDRADNIKKISDPRKRGAGRSRRRAEALCDVVWPIPVRFFVLAPARQTETSQPDEQSRNDSPSRDRGEKNQQRRLRPGELFNIFVPHVSCRGTQTRYHSDLNLPQSHGLIYGRYQAF